MRPKLARQIFAEMRAKGISVAEITEALHVSRRTACYWRKAMGLPRRGETVRDHCDEHMAYDATCQECYDLRQAYLAAAKGSSKDETFDASTAHPGDDWPADSAFENELIAHARADWFDGKKWLKLPNGNFRRWVNGDKWVTIYRHLDGWKGVYEGRREPEEFDEVFSTPDEAKEGIYREVFGKRLPKEKL